MSAKQPDKVRQRGGRAARKLARTKPPHVRAPYIQRRIATYDILDEEGLYLIEDNADIILKETGMEFRDDPEVLDMFRVAGADVKGKRVRFDKGMCREIITASAPSDSMQHARNSENSVYLGGTNTVLAPGWGPPFVHDLNRSRRYATIKDFEDLVKIHQMIPHLHHSGGLRSVVRTATSRSASGRCKWLHGTAGFGRTLPLVCEKQGYTTKKAGRRPVADIMGASETRCLFAILCD